MARVTIRRQPEFKNAYTIHWDSPQQYNDSIDEIIEFLESESTEPIVHNSSQGKDVFIVTLTYPGQVPERDGDPILNQLQHYMKHGEFF